MTTTLSPRDIQSRIRSGASLEELAQTSGMDVDRIEPFAAPVLAEREHVAGTALQCPVRRRGESSSARSLRQTATETLQRRGLDVDEVAWDAWREEDRSWTVQARWQAEDDAHEALFKFDQRGRFSVARNDDARRLIGEAIPGERREPDAEPTINLDDELALVRAVQGDAPLADERLTRKVLQESSEETVQLPRPQQSAEQPAAHEPAADGDEDESTEAESVDDQDGQDDVPDYTDVELEQVDGVYDIVPRTIGEMDALYEMLSSFNEDSVNIYQGLTDPVTPPTPEDQADEAEEPVSELDASELDSAAAEQLRIDQVEPEEGEEVEEDEPAMEPTALIPRPEPTERPGKVAQPAAESVTPPEADALEQDHLDGLDDGAIERRIEDTDVESTDLQMDATPTPEPETEPETDPAPEVAAPADVAAIAKQLDPAPESAAVPAPTDAQAPAEEPAVEQDALVEAPEPAKPAPRKRSRSKRASVPSWDEIMFGSPTPGAPKKD